MQKNKIDKKSKNFIDSTRIWQLKAFVDHAKKNDQFYEKKFSALEVVQNSIIDMNKNKSKFLRRFLTTYIPSLNKKELDELYAKIFKYREFIRNTEYYYKNESEFETEVLDVLTLPEQFSLKEILYYLLMNFVFLPYAENQQDFNNQMIWILKRLDNFIAKLYPKNLYILPINAWAVWEAMEMDGFSSPITIKETVYLHPFLRKVGLLIDFPSKDEYAYEALDEDIVEMSLVLELWKKFKKNWLRLTYATVADLFSRVKWFNQIWNWYLWTIESNNYLKIFLKLENPKIDKDSAGIERQYMQVRIYAEPNEKLVKNWTYEYLSYALKALPEHIEWLIDLLEENFLEVEETKPLDKIIVNFNEAIENYEPANFDDDFDGTDSFSINSKILHKIDTDKIEVEEKIILPENIEKQLNYLLHYLQNREVYLQYETKPTKWAIFFWPPGVGKTESVKYLAKSIGYDFFQLSTDDIRDMYVWESEKKMRKAFEEFYQALDKWKAILYIDEIDGLMWQKWDKDYMEWVRSIFLQELDGFSTNNKLWENGFIIVSTNFPQAVDKALKQRLGFKIKFEMPTEKEVVKFFDYYFDKLKIRGIKIDISSEEVSKIVGNRSYRVLREILDHAIRSSIQQWNIPPVINDIFIKDWLQIAIEQQEEEKKVWFSV